MEYFSLNAAIAKADELRNANISRANEEDSNIPVNQEQEKLMKGENN